MAGERITGLAEVHVAFDRQTTEMQTKLAMRATLKGAAIVRNEAKVIARHLFGSSLRSTGALLKNISIKRERTPFGIAQVHVGVKSGKALGKGYKQLGLNKRSGRVIVTYRDNPFYARFQERGTRHITKHPFLAPALENKQEQAEQAMADQLRKDIAKLT